MRTDRCRAAIVARAASSSAAARVRPPASGPADARQAAVSRLIQIWINRGHLVATIDPLGLMHAAPDRGCSTRALRADARRISTRILHRQPHEAVPKRMKLRDILAQLRTIYGGNIGAEFAHVSDSEERLWLQDEFQDGAPHGRLQPRGDAATSSGS